MLKQKGRGWSFIQNKTSSIIVEEINEIDLHAKVASELNDRCETIKTTVFNMSGAQTKSLDNLLETARKLKETTRSIKKKV